MRRTAIFCVLGVAGCYQGTDVPGTADSLTPPAGASSGLDPAGESSGDTGGETPPENCVDGSVAPTQLQRLTRAEYEATVSAALGVAPGVIPAFLPDERPAGFAANFAQVDTTRAQEYQSAAITIAEAVDIVAVAGCDPAEGRSCAEGLVALAGPTLHRRPVDGDLVEAYAAVYDENADAGSESAIRAVIEALLLSPHFIYHVEIGAAAEDGSTHLTARETANRLAYFFWDAPPDEALLEADVLDPAVRETQARRLAEDPRAARLLAQFFTQWLRLDVELEEKVGIVDGIDGAVMTSMLEELERFVADKSSWPELLLATQTEVDANLASFYGVSPPKMGEWAPLDWDPARRRGIMSLAGVLASQSGPDARVPVHQGRLVLSDLLCLEVPTPPEGAVGQAPPKDPDLTEREYSEILMQTEGCAACHAFLEPVGWLYGHFDPLGRWIDTEKGKPIDAQGEIRLATDDALQGSIEGLSEFVERLAVSSSAKACIAESTLAFALGRSARDEHDVCRVESLTAALDRSDGSIVEMLVALVASEAFVQLNPMEA